MDEYKGILERLEKAYMAFVMTGNKESTIAKLLNEAASIDMLSRMCNRLERELDIAEREIVRRNENGN